MKFIAVCFFTLVAIASNSQNNVNAKYCLDPEGIGAGGMDLVSYFASKKPSKGMPSIKSTFDGVQYYFSMEANKKEFERDPAKYIPQFGGWCSMTLAMGKATKPVYDNFLIKDGKLFLFERTLSVNGKELWLKAPKVNERKAEVTYENLISEGKTAR